MQSQNQNYKVIHDCVHGSIKLPAELSGLLETPEMQRTAQIRQLGLAYLVFPGANHTRLEHMLGTYHLASRFANNLYMKEERKLLLTASLLHDIGHLPFSHTFEEVAIEREQLGHMQISADIIMGRREMVPEDERGALEGAERLTECIDEMDIDREKLAALVLGLRGRGVDDYMVSLLHGPVDVDQLDYLMRDAHYTGVETGRIDAERIIQTASVAGRRMVIDRRGIPAVEGLMVARMLMTSSVYFHRTVRIAELMLSRAVARLGREEFRSAITDTDSSLMERLRRSDGLARDLAIRLKYRRLYKGAFILPIEKMDEEARRKAASLRRRRIERLERELCADAGVEEGKLIVDIAPESHLLGQPVRGKTEVPIKEGRDIRKLTDISSIARAVQIHSRQDWGVMVACEGSLQRRVRKAAAALFM